MNKTSVTLPGEAQADTPAAKPEQKEPEKSIRVDFSKTGGKQLAPSGRGNGSPFVKAKVRDKRIKVLLYGDTGTLKTRTLLQFPGLTVIDMERGTEPYGKEFDFDVLHTTSPDEVMSAVEWLQTHEHPYRTLGIDPITIYWEALQKKWSDIFLRRNKGGKGYKFEFFDLGPRDWMTLKAEFKDLIRKLLSLDMNVILTAHVKKEYAEGEFMKVIGETYDGDKKLRHYFDIVLHHYRDEREQVMARVIKDRFGKLPAEPFEPAFKVFEAAFDAKAIKRKAKPTSYATEDQQNRIRQMCVQLNIKPEQMDKRLAAYGAETLTDLTADNAAVIIGKLEAAAQAIATAPATK